MRRTQLQAMRTTVPALKMFTLHYYGPPVPWPEEYASRIANPKPVFQTPFRDPKNYWGLHTRERMSMHPSLSGLDRYNFSIQETRGGPIGDVPPVPVYRKHIWCMGHGKHKFGHPRIFIKCPPMKVVTCKWCRVKYINMGTAEDNDDNWRDELHKIATQPEPLSEVTQIHRTMNGVLYQSMFQDGRTPDPHVYKASFDPERYRWKKVGRKILPPSEWRALEASEEKAALESGETSKQEQQ